MVGMRGFRLVFDGDQALLLLEEDRDVDVVPFPPDLDIPRLEAGPGKTLQFWRKSPVDVPDEPLQEPGADSVGFGGPEQPRHHVAVAYFVTRVPENIERVELPCFHELPMVCEEPGVVDQVPQVGFHAYALLRYGPWTNPLAITAAGLASGGMM